MKTMRYLLACAGLILFGCKSGSDEEGARHAITNDELLQLIEAEVFELVVPEDVTPDHFAGLAIKYSDGRIDPLVQSAGWRPRGRVKLVCFHPKNGHFEYAFGHGGILRSPKPALCPVSPQGSTGRTRCQSPNPWPLIEFWISEL